MMKKKKNPYVQSDKHKMCRSIVCHADILGFKKKINNSFNDSSAQQCLEDLIKSTSDIYNKVDNEWKHFSPDIYSIYDIKFFSDNIIIGLPLRSDRLESTEGEFNIAVHIMSEYQLELANAGYFIRGGLSYGEHYMDQHYIFGKAYLDALDCDKEGDPPFIFLHDSVVKLFDKYVAKWAENKYFVFTEYNDLLQYKDSIIVNYLQTSFARFENGDSDEIIFNKVGCHRNSILKGLAEFRNNSKVKKKYESLARYHNYVCKKFSEKYLPRDIIHADQNSRYEEYDKRSVRCQKIKKYFIEIDEDPFECFSKIDKNKYKETIRNFGDE
ncbi:hypothetical protein G9409_10595 [Chlorobium sp. BLA1]|uniref:hypothetical protein n=1 Tax=Candidatus Chlorobium masyuteum TaxID=2716876 RepID=UPI001420FB47|nr:hypothetical protein [Candidatus Chlorobium masyuteum]NHQ61022.1 hypothetical protein [Candidatus Chlorobium masyuteum]